MLCLHMVLPCFEGGDGTGIGGRVGEKGVGRGGWEGLYSSPVVNFGYNEL